MKRDKLLRQIQEYDFAVNELTLYLDSHPNDAKALQMHCALSKEANLLQELYQKEYSSLVANNASQKGRWEWIESPWPWENNCEVK